MTWSDALAQAQTLALAHDTAVLLKGGTCLGMRFRMRL